MGRAGVIRAGLGGLCSMNGYLNAMRRYFDFRGRSSRAEFWFFALFYVIIYVVASILDGFVLGSGEGGFAIFTTIVLLVHLIPSLAVSARRLHYIDRTGLWILLAFVPSILMVVLLGGSVFAMVSGGDAALDGMAAMGATMFLVGILGIAVAIVLLVFYCTPGTPGPNRFGPPEAVV